MTGNGTERFLSRRERRRLQAQQESAQAETSEPEELSDSSSQNVDESPAEDLTLIDESAIEISPYDEHGKLRSRREIRELRQRAIEELKRQREAESPEPTVDVPTEALSLEELQEISESQGDEPRPVAVSTDPNSGEESGESETEPARERDPEASEDILDDIDEETVKEPEVPTAPEETYSFPDIQPLEEDPPVFDDPTSRTVGNRSDEELPQEGASAFDDVIERAVADESSTVHQDSSSLILPTIPDAEALSGSIGATGELFVTGSIELPKTLGETGGHLGLQDSVGAKDAEEDPVEILDLSSMYESSEFDSAPISAKQAVSSRSAEQTGSVTPEVQKDSKKSIALALTGGGLLLVIIAGGVWLFTSGFLG